MTNKIRSLTLELLSNIEDLQTQCVQMHNQPKCIDMPTSLFTKIKYFLINCKNGIRELWDAGLLNQKFHWKEILQNLLSIKFLRTRIQEFIKPPKDNIDLFNAFFEKIKQEILDFIQKMSPIDDTRPAINVEIF